MEKTTKRKKFHDALLNFYHPTPPLPPQQQPPLASSSSSSSSKQFDDEEPLTLINGDINFNLDPASVDEVEEENSASDATDCGPKKLTRAQRKRIRKKKLKEAASVRRKFIGPLFPSDHQDSREEHCTDNSKPVQEKQY